MTLVQRVRDLVRRAANKRSLPRVTDDQLVLLNEVYWAQAIRADLLARRLKRKGVREDIAALSDRGLVVVTEQTERGQRHEFVYLTCFGVEAVNYALGTGRL